MENTNVGAVSVDRWPSERPLGVLVGIAAALMWILLTVSLIGIGYAVVLGALLFLSHLTFIAHLRGNAVKLGPDQMPELYERVCTLAQRVGLPTTPEVYVMQAGGALNALATKFLRTRFIVLFSDLLDACSDNVEARDMIIGHELGHLKAGHLNGLWFFLPGMWIPLLGSAYSRAREYTSDRYGFAVCNDQKSALLGLCILAAGGRQGPHVNLNALVRQRDDLNTAWMTLARWFASHPPIADRIAAVAPSLFPSPARRTRGLVGGVAIVAVVLLGSIGVPVVALPHISAAFTAAKQAKTAVAVAPGALKIGDVAAAKVQVRGDLQRFAALIAAYRSRTNELPKDEAGLAAAWKLLRPEQALPQDPFTGEQYGYATDGKVYAVWSEGPDSTSDEDDIVFTSGEDAAGAKGDGLSLQ